MNEKLPVPDKDEARRMTALDLALRLNSCSSGLRLVTEAKIIEKYIRGE